MPPPPGWSEFWVALWSKHEGIVRMLVTTKIAQPHEKWNQNLNVKPFGKKEVIEEEKMAALRKTCGFSKQNAVFSTSGIWTDSYYDV